MRRILAILGACALQGGLPSGAATSTYRLELPESASAAFEVPFRVEHVGTVVVEAEWDGARIVSFRIDGPGIEGAAARRSGPSPQRLEVEVGDEAIARGGTWTLSIRAPLAREGSTGTLSLALPDAPEVVEAREKEAAPPPPPPPEPDPWTVPRSAPAGAGGALVGLFDSVETFRVLLHPEQTDGAYDACGWQSPALRWLAAQRDALASGGAALPPPARSVLGRVARAVRSVETMRTSENPILAGPAPEDPVRHRAWLSARRDELRILERELDLVGEMLRGGYAPELEDQEWLHRFAACLTACERHFEERVRVGPGGASQRDLAEAQWPAILAAGDALDRLASIGPASSPALP